MKLKTKNLKLKTKGFTLIELLVAMSLFVVITSIATGNFIRSLRTQRATTGMMAINDNASLTLEQMMREIRTGSNFTTTGDSQLNFTNAAGQMVIYKLENEAIKRGVGVVAPEPITAANVKIRMLKFSLMGQNPGDGMPPRITISMSVGSNYRDLENVVTNIQTTVSARNIDT
jgi:prepilin-type N-terminal cleavage/methylation domain-containing protein